jgi:hypothetical protein
MLPIPGKWSVLLDLDDGQLSCHIENMDSNVDSHNLGSEKTLFYDLDPLVSTRRRSPVRRQDRGRRSCGGAPVECARRTLVGD